MKKQTTTAARRVYTTSVKKVLEDPTGAKAVAIVVLSAPHVEKYGKEARMRLAYAVPSSARPGDRVVVPPMPLFPGWTPGVVESLGPGDYDGPLKHAKLLGRRR